MARTRGGPWTWRWGGGRPRAGNGARLELGGAGAILDTAHNAFVSMDVEGRVIYWNPRAEEIFGWSRREALGQVVGDLIVPAQHREAHRQGLRRFLDTGEGPVLNKRLALTGCRRTGEEFPVEMTISALAGEPHGWTFHAFVQDLTEQKAAEHERAELEQRSSRWFDMSNDMLCEASLEHHFTRLNAAWERFLGFTNEELMARPFVEFVHPDDVPATIVAAGGLAAGDSEIFDFENRYATKDGGWRWLLWSCRSDGTKIYGVAKDITERKELELERDQLLALAEVVARTDTLTGLPNRRAWDEELQREVARARRRKEHLAVVMLDIDQFKAFNDSNGHQAGDALLREAATNWRLALRISDFAARYGGDEFGMLLPDCPPGYAEAALERVRAATPGGTAARPASRTGPRTSRPKRWSPAPMRPFTRQSRPGATAS